MFLTAKPIRMDWCRDDCSASA